MVPVASFLFRLMPVTCLDAVVVDTFGELDCLATLVFAIFVESLTM